MTSDSPGISYEFGPFSLDVNERVLLQDGQIVPLRPKDLDLLLALVANSGRLLNKDELLQRVWPDSFVEEANLSHHVFTLRKVLGEEKGASRYIETVPRRGYRFVAGVTARPRSAVSLVSNSSGGPVVADDGPSESSELIVSGAPAESAAVRVGSRSRQVILGFVAIGVLLAAGLSVAIDSWRQKGSEIASGGSAYVIAVLPFKPVVPDQRDEALELGMADTLITKLGRTRHITTRPIGSVRQYGGLEQDPIAAGKALGVGIVLDGSIQRAGDRVRVTVRVLSVEDGGTLWAEQYDGRFTDIFALQDTISDQVTRSLALRLSADEHRQLAKRYTDNIAAYELYLKGRFLWNKRTEEGIESAIDYFRQAVAAAPNYALAYAGLADSYALLSNYNVAPNDGFTQAREAAEQALALDDTLAEAHTSLAFVKEAFDWDWTGAEREYRRALDLDPNYASAHHRYGVFLCMTGRCTAGLVELERARQLDPTSMIISADAGLGYYLARRYDEAIDQLRKAEELEPTSPRAHFYLVDSLAQTGRFEEAITEARKASELSRGRAAAALAFSYAAAGRRAEARQILDDLSAQARQAFVQPLGPAAAYAALGEPDSAFVWLEKGLEQRAYVTVRVVTDPRFDPLRSNPRYGALLRRLNLSQ